MCVCVWLEDRTRDQRRACMHVGRKHMWRWWTTLWSASSTLCLLQWSNSGLQACTAKTLACRVSLPAPESYRDEKPRYSDNFWVNTLNFKPKTENSQNKPSKTSEIWVILCDKEIKLFQYLLSPPPYLLSPPPYLLPWLPYLYFLLSVTSLAHGSKHQKTSSSNKQFLGFKLSTVLSTVM